MTTPLSDLVRRLALLSGSCPYLMTARLLGKDGTRIELKATHSVAGEIQEYTHHVTFTTLERDGSAALAKEFAREARAALNATLSTGASTARLLARKARS